MRPLAVIVYTALAIGVAAAVAAWAMPPRRVLLLVVAAVAFAIAGVLGILSIGLVFVLVSAGCATLAIRAASQNAA